MPNTRGHGSAAKEIDTSPCPAEHSATGGKSSWNCDPWLRRKWRSAVWFECPHGKRIRTELKIRESRGKWGTWWIISPRFNILLWRDLLEVTRQGPTFSLSVLIWMAFGMSLAVFSFVIEVTSFSRIVICMRGGFEEEWLCLHPELIYDRLQTMAMRGHLISGQVWH